MSSSISSRRAGGFTLIELMITVVIVGILTAIAYPSYRAYVVKSNRAVTQAFMATVADREQQYLMDARTYGEASTSAEFNSVLGLTVPAEVSKFYTVTVAYVGGNTRTFNVAAVPIAGKMNASDGTLTLDNTGAKGPAGKW